MRKEYLVRRHPFKGGNSVDGGSRSGNVIKEERTFGGVLMILWVFVVVVGGVEKGEVAKETVLIFFKEVRCHREGERAIRARESVTKSMNDSNSVVV